MEPLEQLASQAQPAPLVLLGQMEPLVRLELLVSPEQQGLQASTVQQAPRA
jgi:hypothetical protein